MYYQTYHNYYNHYYTAQLIAQGVIPYCQTGFSKYDHSYTSLEYDNTTIMVKSNANASNL